MKTEFSQFCQDYAEVLQPLRGILKESVENLRDKRDAEALKSTLSGLTDLHHRLKTLVDKVEDQQAYLIIFGPLKSGKSTLMNAISSAYVSEVSSLPAYPCLVYLRHADEPEITVTRYSGKTDEFADSSEMQELITRHHAELADRIRVIEEQGEVFDPSTHDPNAIRRIDIGMEAEALKNSCTVLVDTPGLYSRMRFGYDLMTREFRDSAACAVFVVKTDNLFLEQVFNEFSDLLNLFSRIFLVVNIDTGKRDLGPDGELHPSLESSDPERIVEAFRSFSMSAPLQRAFAEGRLKIYPIDVLTAAASNLQAAASGSALNQSQDLEVVEETLQPASDPGPGPGSVWAGFKPGVIDSVASAKAALAPTSGPGSIWAGFKPGVIDSLMAVELPSCGHAGNVGIQSGATFEQFLADLTDYLNSSEYLVNFMRDSLRQGRTLLEELEDNVSADCLTDFRQQLRSLESELDTHQKRRQAVGELDEVNWRETFASTEKICATDGEQFASSQSQRLRSDISAKLDAWFKSDQSLEDLLRDHLRPGIKNCLEQIREDIGLRVKRVTSGSRCGAELSDSQLASLSDAGISMSQIQQANDIGPQPAALDEIKLEHSLLVKAIPVRKTLLDWLLFRSAANVRRRTFGADQQPDQPVPAKVKTSRLGDVGKIALGKQLAAKVDEVVPGVATGLAAEAFKDYGERFSEAMENRLDQLRAELDESIPLLSERISDCQEILSTLDQLCRDAGKVADGVARLEQQFGQSHPALATPVAPGEDPEADSGSLFIEEEAADDAFVADLEDDAEQGGDSPLSAGLSQGVRMPGDKGQSSPPPILLHPVTEGKSTDDRPSR